tara:strand:- start:4013 stop:4384 length:372 start_codon:yes stop_codon:yes gene_type:complete
MNIGELDRRIDLEYPTLTNDSYGGNTASSWNNWRTVWAKIEWKGGDEKNQTDKSTAITKVDFYIRNLDVNDFISGTVGVTSIPTMEWRIKYSDGGVDKYYYIHNIEQIDGRDAIIKIITEQKD